MNFQDHGLEGLFTGPLCGGLRSKGRVTFGKVLDNKIRLVLVTLPVAVINKYSDNI